MRLSGMPMDSSQPKTQEFNAKNSIHNAKVGRALVKQSGNLLIPTRC